MAGRLAEAIRRLRTSVTTRGSFGSRALTLTTGTVVAQGITLAATPVLTRQYTPVDYGVFGLYLAVVGTVSLIASGRFEIAVPLPSEEHDALRLLWLSLLVLLAATALLAVVAVVAGSLFPSLSQGGILTWAVPASVLAAGVAQSLGYWAVRRGGVRALSASRVAMAVLAAAASISLGLLGARSAGLVLGYLMGQIGGMTVLVFSEAASIRAVVNGDRKSGGSWRALAVSYRDYPLVNAPHALLDGLRDSGVALLVVSLFGPAANGFFSLATRVLRAPVTLVGSSMSQAFLQDAARIRDSAQLRERTVRLMRIVAVFSLPLYALIALAAPQLFAWVFGAEWREAGQYARILAPSLYALMVIAPFAQLPSIMSRMRHAFLVALADTAAKLTGLAAAGALHDARLGVAVLSLTSLVSCVYLAFWYVRIASASPSVEDGGVAR